MALEAIGLEVKKSGNAKWIVFPALKLLHEAWKMGHIKVLPKVTMEMAVVMELRSSKA